MTPKHVVTVQNGLGENERERQGWVKRLITSWSVLTTTVRRKYGSVRVSRKIEQEKSTAKNFFFFFFFFFFVFFGLSNNTLPFSLIYHQLSPTSHSQHLKISFIVMKSGNLNFLESSGPLQACDGTALPLYKTANNVSET